MRRIGWENMLNKMKLRFNHRSLYKKKKHFTNKFKGTHKQKMITTLPENISTTLSDASK